MLKDHVYRCVWKIESHYVYYNYIRSVDPESVYGEAIATNDKSYETVYSYNQIRNVLPLDGLCRWSLDKIQNMLLEFEDLGTYEEFASKYPELLL